MLEVSDRKVLHLLKMWLEAPVEETDVRKDRPPIGGT